MPDSSALLYQVVKHLRLVENRTCADCNRSLGDGTNAYAQLQFQVWLCQNCAKVHVIHIGADHLIAAMSNSWKEEDITAICKVKNRSQNEVLERYCEGVEKPGPDGPEHLREAWIRCKYNFMFVIPFSTLRDRKLPPIKPPKPPKRLTRRSGDSSKLDPGAVMKKAVEEGLKTELPTRFVDCFIHIGPRPYTEIELLSKMDDHKKLPSHCEDLIFQPTIRDRFPSKDHSDAPLPEMAAPFVFPEGMRLQPKDKSPQITTFVLTDEHRVKIYGAALTFHELLEPSEVDTLMGTPGKQSKDWALIYCPRAIAVIGHYPFFHAYSEFLKDLFHTSLSSSPVPLERYVQYFISETPLPPLGKVEVRLQLSNQTMLISRPPINHLPMVDFSYRPLFACLSTESVLLVFRLLAAEFSLCFATSNPSLLTPIQEAFLSFLFPMVWQGVYIPMLPRSMLDILEAPVPVVMGLDSSYIEHIPLDRRPNSMVFVDIDKNEVRLGGTLLNGLSLLDIAALHAEAHAHEGMDMESRAEVLAFLKEPMPARQTKKLANKLETFASCVFHHHVAENLLKNAGMPFPDLEHLSPLTSFAMEAGSVVSKESDTGVFSEGGGKSNIQAATRGLKLLNKLGGRCIMDPCNNTTKSSLFSPWDERDTFDAYEIRRAFLRFFVSLFMESDNYYKSASSDDAAKGSNDDARASQGRRTSLFRASVLSSSARRASSAGRMIKYLGGKAGDGIDDLTQGHTGAFFERLKLTQMYSQFNDERVTMPGLPEIRFFEESMKEKINRSKMTFTKNRTPFLSDESDMVKEIYSPPPPSISGLQEGARSEYSQFPIFSDNNLGPRRVCKALVSGPEKRRKVHADSALAWFVTNRALSVPVPKQKSTEMYTNDSTSDVSSKRTSQSSRVLESGNYIGNSNKPPSEGSSQELRNSEYEKASEHTFENILLQGRDRYFCFLKGLKRCQSAIRMHQSRLRFKHMVSSAEKIQNTYRCHRAYEEVKRRRLLWRAALSETHVVRVQSITRMFVKSVQFKRTIAMATRIQAMHRCMTNYRQYKVNKRRLSKLGAHIRGYVVRNRSLSQRVQRIKEYQRALPLLWRLSYTSYYYRALFWNLYDHKGRACFLDVAIFAEEVARIYRITGLAEAVIEGATYDEGDSRNAMLLERVPQSHLWKAVVTSGGMSSGKDQLASSLGGTYQKSHEACRNALAAEREKMYQILKYSVSEAEKQELYKVMNINGKGRFRKKALLDNLWADPFSSDNILASVQVTRAVRRCLSMEAGKLFPFFILSPQTLSSSKTDDEAEREWKRQKRATKVNKACAEVCRVCFALLSSS